MKDKEMVGEVNDLIEKNSDAAKGFKEAADHASSPKLKSYLDQQAAERKNFAKELSVKLRAYHPDVTPDKDGSTSGALHRGWLSVKAALSMNNDESVLEECIRGDKAAKKQYEETLSNFGSLTNETTELVREQKIKLEKTLNKVKTIEDLH